MYDFNVVKQASGGSGEAAMALIRDAAPEEHTVRAPTSTLSKVLAWHCESPLLPTERIAHQAELSGASLPPDEEAKVAEALNDVFSVLGPPSAATPDLKAGAHDAEQLEVIKAVRQAALSAAKTGASPDVDLAARRVEISNSTL